MSGPTQLAGPGPGSIPASQPANTPVLAMPVMQQPSPYWVDPSAVAAAQAPTQHIHYITVSQPPPSSAPTAPVPTPEASAPRPRKPYTTTKVREMWSPAEHDRMLEGLRLFKRDWAKVTRFVGSRSAAQVRSHAQKYFDRVARDKTDDYVPRARPKRKSATPYPRKARDQPSQQQNNFQSAQVSHPLQIPHPTNSVSHTMAIPVPPVHHTPAMPMPQQATIAHAHQIHHPSVPVQLTTQSPLLAQMPTNSPCLSQPPQHSMTVQQGVPQHMYSPYLALYPPASHDPQRIQTSPVPHPSPMSFMGSPYTVHSPASHLQMSMPQPHQQLYSLFSPMTPGGFPPGMGRSPSISHAQVSLVAPSHVQARPVQQQHVPTHSHPGGPIENCRKCAALQRYGNVLQEIGEFRHPLMTHENAVQEAFQTAPDQVATSMPVIDGASRPQSLDRTPRTNITQTFNRASSPSPEGSGSSSDGQRSGRSSFPSAEYLKQSGGAKGAADHRAHRARVMKARKARNRNSTAKATSMSPSVDGSEESNESFNSSRIMQVDESLVTKGREKSKGRTQTTKAKDLQKKVSGVVPAELNTRKKMRTSSSADARPAKRSRRSNQTDVSYKIQSSEDMSSELTEMRNSAYQASRNSSPSTRVISDKSEASDGKRMDSPDTETYSPSERKEIFDAVKSLQILAKTSSSSSLEAKGVGLESISET